MYPNQNYKRFISGAKKPRKFKKWIEIVVGGGMHHDAGMESIKATRVLSKPSFRKSILNYLRSTPLMWSIWYYAVKKSLHISILVNVD